MLSKLKKVPKYALKLMNPYLLMELIEILKIVKPSLVLMALRSRLTGNSFLIKIKNLDIPNELNFYLDSLKNHRGKHVTEDFYFWHFNDKKMCANYIQFLHLYFEYFQNFCQTHYHYDWNQKRVLDVGGFVGDSALFFLENHASEVYIYEPIPQNLKALKYNLKNLKNRVFIHEKAVSNQDGQLTLSSKTPQGCADFCLEPGNYSFQCEGISFKSVLLKHQIDVAKIDCEGSEKYLCDLDDNLIKTVPYWIIETHDLTIYQNILNKFATCGFKKVKDFSITPKINLLHFQL